MGMVAAWSTIALALCQDHVDATAIHVNHLETPA